MKHRLTLALLLILGCVGATAERPSHTHAASVSNRSAPAPTPSDEPIEFLGSIGGVTGQLSVNGTLMFISEGTKLSIIDVANPGHPFRRGSIELSAPLNEGSISTINDLAISDGFAYLALGRGGIQIVDVHDPDHPRLRGRYQAPGLEYVSQIEAQAGMIYTAGIFSDSFLLHVIDAGDPDVLVLRGELSLVDVAYDMQLVGNRIYVTTRSYQQDLLIIDVGDPSQPSLSGVYGSLDISLFTFHVVGSMIYALDYSENFALLLIDASNPSQPQLRSSYRLSNLAVGEIWAEGDTVYLFSGFLRDVQVIDVSDPTAPQYRGAYTSTNEIGDVQVVGGRAYVLIYGTITIAELDTPSQPQVYSHFRLSSYTDELQVAGDLLYIIGSEIGLQIYDISDPAHPVLRGAYYGTDPEQPETFGSLYVHGNIAYIIDDRELTLLDVSDPTSPTLLERYEDIHIFSNLRVVGNRLYGFGKTADLDALLLFILDISDPTDPRLLNHYPLPTTYAYDLEIVDNLAYLVDDSGGWLIIVDVSEPLTPIRLGTIQLAYSPNGHFVEVVDGTAYVTGRQLQIVDVRDPDRPVLRSTYDVEMEALGIAIDGTLLYMVDSVEARLHIADITSPFSPRPRATYRLPGRYPWDVDVANDLVFVNTQGLGLRIFRAHPERFPGSIFMPLLSKPAADAYD
ncbi:MAG TPA: hypothetical protein VGD69_25650 [Herpetosiphonaceae bacterium]